MIRCLIQAAYKPEAVIALAKNPQNRVEAIRTVVEKLGGQVGGWRACPWRERSRIRGDLRLSGSDDCGRLRHRRFRRGEYQIYPYDAADQRQRRH
jgi:hypothetical protein